MKWTSSSLFLLLLLGGLSACQREQQISPAVRAAVLAALGPHVTDADATEFLRSAKLASRTKRDTEMVAMLDEVVDLARSAAQDDSKAEEHRRESQKFGSKPPSLPEDCSRFDNTEGGVSSARMCNEDNEMAKQANRETQNKATENAYEAQFFENESKKEKQQIKDLVQKLQAALSE